jgi:hypothetical protein
MRRPGDDQRDVRATAGEVRAVAARLGVGKRMLWRWIAAGRQPQRHGSNRRRFMLTPKRRDADLRLGGNVAAVWRETRVRARPAGAADAARRVRARAVAGRACTCATRRRTATSGKPTTRSSRFSACRLGARRGRRPWVMLFPDDLSRAITGRAISLVLDAEGGNGDSMRVWVHIHEIPDGHWDAAARSSFSRNCATPPGNPAPPRRRTPDRLQCSC